LWFAHLISSAATKSDLSGVQPRYREWGGKRRNGLSAQSGGASRNTHLCLSAIGMLRFEYPERQFDCSAPRFSEYPVKYSGLKSILQSKYWT
jgi:hypothetical protein